MHIAVVVPAFNIAGFLPDAIVSLLDQTHEAWDLVVVDDGSSDATAAVAARFADSRIRVIRQQHAGVSAARNAGLAAVLRRNRPVQPSPSKPQSATQVEYQSIVPDALLFLDGDDWLAPNALSELATALSRAPCAVAAVGCFAQVDASGTARLGATPSDGDLLESLLTRNLLANGGHLLIRRQAVEAAGDFRPDLGFGEDWEYWVRVALRGVFVAVSCRSPLLFVRERAGSTYLSRATDPGSYRCVLDAIYRNPEVTQRVGPVRLAVLERRARAEIAWTVGRELIRHGRHYDGWRWLGRSVRTVPSPKRLVLFGLSPLCIGPFRHYPSQPDRDLLDYRQCD